MAFIRTSLVAAVTAISLFGDLAPAQAGKVVPGPVRVCRKPMLAAVSSFADQVKPGADAWTKLAERQAEQEKFCYMAGDIELIEKGKEIDAGLNTTCTEWRASAKGDEVYVVIGNNRTWGRCP